MLNFLKDRREKVVVFGTGAGGSSFFRHHRRRFKVLAFADNNPQKHGGSFLGKSVCSAAQISELAYDKIIIASDYYAEIYQQLVHELCLPAERILLFHEFQSQNSLWQDIVSCWRQRMYQAMCSANPVVASIFFRLMFPTAKARNGLRLIPLCWLDQYHQGQVQIFKPADRVKISGPANIDAPISCYEVSLPAMAMYHFDHGVFTSTSRSVLLSDNKLVMERVIASDINKADYAGGQVVYHSTYRACFMTTEPPIGIIQTGLSRSSLLGNVLKPLAERPMIWHIM